MTDPSFAAMTTVIMNTTRKSLTGYGPHLYGLKCTPLAPVDAETRQRLMINTPNRTWEVHLQDNPDVKQGDKAQIAGAEYPILYKEPFTWLPTGDKRMRLILEDITN